MEQKSRPTKKSSTLISQKAIIINSNTKNNLNYWSKDQDEKLLKIVSDYITQKGNKIKWKFIALNFEAENKTSKQCYARYRQINPNLNKGKWTEEEQDQLLMLIQKHGTNWAKIASIMKNRSGKQIRNHYYACLLTSDYTPEEDEKLKELYLKFGTKFSLMAKYFKGKSPESIKQRFYSYIKKSLTSIPSNNGILNLASSSTNNINNNINKPYINDINDITKISKSAKFPKIKKQISHNSSSSESSNYQKSNDISYN